MNAINGHPRVEMPRRPDWQWDHPPAPADRRPADPPAPRSSAWTWQDPATIPPRPWLYGHHLLRRQVSVTVAPPGLGKSSLGIVEALAMATGRRLLGEWNAGPVRVWLYNLEDPRDELDRRITAAMLHHGIAPDAIGDRLRVASGRDTPLCTAVQLRDGPTLLKPELAALEAEIRQHGIDVLVIDPFVSSHRVIENDNGAVDMVAKAWARLAERCDCAVELVHHTSKAYGAAQSSEAARGGSALLGAARSGRVLNRMTEEERQEAGVQDDPATYFSITRDKANLAPSGARVWRRMASVDLGQGDHVGVAEEWTWPDAFDGIGASDLLAVQQALDGKAARYSDQSGDRWAGVIVAETLGLTVASDKRRIKRMIETWIKNGALRKVLVKDEKRDARPCLEVGEWASL